MKNFLHLFFVFIGVMLVPYALAGDTAAASDSLRSASEENEASDRSQVATINSGIKNTLSGASITNPLINDLASIQDLAAMQPDLSVIHRLLEDLGMTFYLDQSRDMTMFVPVNEAFSSLPYDIHSLPWELKWRILQYHVIPHDVLDLDDALKETDEIKFATWEGSDILIKRERINVASSNTQAEKINTAESTQFSINGALVVSHPPRIETFNGAVYKINKLLIPSTMNVDDFKPAELSRRVNPEIRKPNLRKPTDISTNISETNDGSSTSNLVRAANDPLLPGSIRPDPLGEMSQQKPDFLHGINRQYARWEDATYQRIPRSQIVDRTVGHDEVMGFYDPDSEESSPKIKVLGLDSPVVSSGSTSPPDTILFGNDQRHVPDATTVPKNTPSQQDAPEEAVAKISSFGLSKVVAPQIQALGLAEGLLPAEEILTEFWGPNGLGHSRSAQQDAQGARLRTKQSVNDRRIHVRDNSSHGSPIKVLLNKIKAASSASGGA